ncbi:hypothetical protein DS909_07060 [Phaeobacter gallaeciensis]|uniref:Excalibur calcium-binding domain-containing protein n=2 Tax=Roseobacteraceae TaxID=2854170 RepID=A0A366X4G6_9RHOB|nr:MULTISPECIES: excalibur calcium-binding domain-containing protein [Roseobacteraceae]MBT3143247.1 excalibur calcium-binding domain-containing protein [Falsiruegeria litorea]MBT8167511.1 excalibur calcium-binding domain-containing protein [Falsiruegeria litorea]RBW57899.1 hypothetical protein DS909_07060 [Phaeobacter gallaeciensis]
MFNRKRIIQEVDLNPRSVQRIRRAEAQRAQFLSPRRIVMLLLSLPVIACSVGIGAYIRTSPYEPEAALQHLVAMWGCDAARSVGLGPTSVGEPGYHLRNDGDQDGVACEPYRHGSTVGTVQGDREVPNVRITHGASASQGSETPVRGPIGSAKFVRP